MKWSLLVERTGSPLGIVIAGANVHDTKLLDATLDAVVVRRPSPVDYPQHLCLDRGYDNPTGETAVRDHEYIGHTRQRPGQPPDAPDTKRYPARRWVIERTIAWLSKFRGVLVRYEVYDENYLGLLQFACALIWTRVWHTLKAQTVD